MHAVIALKNSPVSTGEERKERFDAVASTTSDQVDRPGVGVTGQ